MNWHLGQVIARQFCVLLREYLGDEKVNVAAALNDAEKDSGVCHTHDFCDANMVMDEAFRKIGRPIKEVPPDDATTDLWNGAWGMAKAAGFVPELVQMPRYRIEPCQCGGYMGKPCADVFLEGMGMKSEGRFDRETAEELKRTLESHEAVVHALTMVRDADNDCKKDGFPSMPSIARLTIDRALALAGVT